MPKKMTPEQVRVLAVLERISAEVSKDSDAAEMYAEMLETGLSELHSQDAFGSEGQCDPRGDFRNGAWSMQNVEHVDV